MNSCFTYICLCLIILFGCSINLSLQQVTYNTFEYDYPYGPYAYPYNGLPTRSNLRNNYWLAPGQELIFSRGGNNRVNYNAVPLRRINIAHLNAGIPAGIIRRDFNRIPHGRSNAALQQFNPAPNFINNPPPPFKTETIRPTPEFFDCLQRCPTTSEYNPVCATDRQVYNNEQKFHCARRCGANIEIVRRTSCDGLFPMQRG